MSCDCYKIGGPWIDVDPNCPFHGYDAQRQQEIEEQRKQELEDRVSELEQQVAWLMTMVTKGG